MCDLDEEYGISRRNKAKGVVKNEQEVDRIKGFAGFHFDSHPLAFTN